MAFQRIWIGVCAALVVGLIGFLLGRLPHGDREVARPLTNPPLTWPKTSARHPLVTQRRLGPSRDTVASEQPRRAAVPEADSTTKAAPLIAFVDNRLSLHVQTQSLKDIVEQISDLSGVPIFFSKDITDRGVSHHFDNVLLDEGLRMVLQALDLFFFYAADGQVSPALLAVWAYPQGHGTRLVPMPPEAWASTAELREHLRDADPELRVRAAEGLIERQGKQALDVVEAALEDAEAKVRYRALYKAIRVGVPLHGDVLRQLLSADPSPTVRFLALEALPKVPHIQPETLRESLEFALYDADERVREQAGALLDELEPIDVLLAPEDPLQTQLQERSIRATAAP